MKQRYMQIHQTDAQEIMSDAHSVKDNVSVPRTGKSVMFHNNLSDGMEH